MTAKGEFAIRTLCRWQMILPPLGMGGTDGSMSITGPGALVALGRVWAARGPTMFKVSHDRSKAFAELTLTIRHSSKMLKVP